MASDSDVPALLSNSVFSMLDMSYKDILLFLFNVLLELHSLNLGFVLALTMCRVSLKCEDPPRLLENAE